MNHTKRVNLPVFSENRVDFFACAALVITALFAWHAWLRPGVAGNDDILNSIYRAFALDLCWEKRCLYPRLSPELAFGYGGPLFLYYAPLTSFVAALIAQIGAGFVTAIKLVHLFALILSGWGAYFLGNSLFKARSSGFLIAIFYVIAPYQLTNLYQRGATAEAFAMALLPWILWAALTFHERGGWGRFAVFVAALALLFVTHNITSLLFLPVLIGFILFAPNARNRKKRVAAQGIGIALALGMTAFFWLPAIGERDLVKISNLVSGFYDPVTHLLPVEHLIQSTWLFNYAPPESYRLGLAMAIAVGLSLAGIFFQKTGTRRWIIFFAIILGVGLLLQLSGARWFWETVPLVKFAQFPWRLLSFMTLSSAVLIGSLPAAIAKLLPRFQQTRTRVAIFVILIAYLSFTGTASLWPKYADAWANGHFTNGDIRLDDLYARGQQGFELFSDYQPTSVLVDMATIPEISVASAPASTSKLAAVPEIQLIKNQPFFKQLRVQSPLAWKLITHQFYFPGWEIFVDGQPTLASATGELGLLSAQIAAGQHVVEIRFGNTPLRNLADAISIVAGTIWLACLLLALQQKNTFGSPQKRWAFAAAFVAVIAVLVLMGTRVEKRPAEPSALSVNFNNEAILTGYQLERTDFRPGDALKIALFWLSLTKPTADYKVFVHLRNATDTETWAQHDGRPVFGFTPTTRWEAGEFIEDEHTLALPKTMPAGNYQLVVGLYETATLQNVPVNPTPARLHGARVFVTTIHIAQP